MSGRKSHPARIMRRLSTGSGWVCHICSGPTLDVDAADPLEPLAPTLDHVKPKAQGGANNAENYAIAHRWCNSARGSMSLKKARLALSALALKPKHAKNLVREQAYVTYAKPHVTVPPQERERDLAPVSPAYSSVR